MHILSEIKKRLKHIIAPFLCGVIFVYFSYHAINGDRGLFKWLALRQDFVQTKRIALNIANEKMILEKKVASLSPESLDLDMLEERARAILNLGNKNELVIVDDIF